MRIAAPIVLALALLLTGCSDEAEEVIEPHIPISTQGDNYVLGDVHIESAGNATGYIGIDDNSVYVYPYYDLSENIIIRRIVISDQNWWETITEDVDVEECTGFQIFQDIAGTSYGYMPLGDTHALFCTTTNLPKDYLKLYMSKIWLSDT